MAKKSAATKKNDTAAASDESRAALFDSFVSSTTEVMTLDAAGMDVEAIATGAVSLDVALGIGGIPKGRIVEIYGPEHSGKTSVCLSIAGSVHKAGGTVGFVDAEHALDPEWAKTFGVNPSRMAINQPSSGEAGLDMVISMTKSGAFDLIIVDSVAALVPQSELDGEMTDQSVGTHARMMSKAMRKLTGIASETGTTIIFINQLREKIGVMFGSPETTTGGKALKFYASVRLDIRSAAGARLAHGKDDPYGQTINCRVVKNKVAAPFKKCSFDLIYGKGIDNAGAILEMGQDRGLIQRSGASYIEVSTGERIEVGKDNAKAKIAADPVLAERILAGIYASLKPGEIVETDEELPEDVAAALEAEGGELNGDIEIEALTG